MESRSGKDRDERDKLEKDNINTKTVAKAYTNLDLPTREEVTTTKATAELKVADNLVQNVASVPKPNWIKLLRHH